MNAAAMRKLKQVGVALLVLPFVLFSLLMLEGTGGHDGWLCEWGYDTGPTSDGCV